MQSSASFERLKGQFLLIQRSNSKNCVAYALESKSNTDEK